MACRVLYCDIGVLGRAWDLICAISQHTQVWGCGFLPGDASLPAGWLMPRRTAPRCVLRFLGMRAEMGPKNPNIAAHRAGPLGLQGILML